MKYIYKIFLVLLISLFTGCNLDINNDPNRLTENTVTGALVFPAAAHETGQRVASGNFTFLNHWIGYWASSVQFALNFTETTYAITPTFSDAIWQNHYNVLFDLEKARAKSLAVHDTLTAGASMMLSAMLWQEMVDIFGNVPYSQALQISTYPQPVYDNGQDIYNDLQKKLDLAISYMHTTPSLSFPFVNTDVVCHGDTVKWKKFGNTLKLRLLLRQSEISGFNPTAEVTKIKNKGGVLQSGESLSINLGYQNATSKQSPYWASFGTTVSGAAIAPSVVANSYFVDLMYNNGDPRVDYFFADIGGKAVGNIYGNGIPNPATNPSTASLVGPGLLQSPSQDQWILSSTESLFLEAEAIDRGWLPGDPSGKYAQAITESFLSLGLATTDADAYILNFPYVTGDNYHNTLFQKYIALCGTAPTEAWSDLRRIGYDIIPKKSPSGYSYYSANPSAPSAGVVPVRLLIAQNEYTTNAANAQAQGDLNQFTSKIFWDVK